MITGGFKGDGGDGRELLISAVCFVSLVGAELNADELELWGEYCGLLAFLFRTLACFREGDDGE